MSRSSKSKAVSPRNAHIVVLDGFDQGGTGNFQVHECGYLPNTEEWAHDNYRSPFWRLYHNAHQGASIVVKGRRYPLVPGKVVVIPQGIPFDSYGRDGIQQHLWIHFSPPLTPFFTVQKFSRPPHAALAANIHDLRRHLFRHHEDDQQSIRILYHSCLAVLNSWLVGTPFEIGKPMPTSLNRVLEIIDQELATPLSNCRLAQEAGMSLKAFSQAFKTHVGDTPSHYIKIRRIREASRLLSFSQRSIEDISESLGFANRHHFSRIFHEVAGRSPALFRREAQTGSGKNASLLRQNS